MEQLQTRLDHVRAQMAVLELMFEQSAAQTDKYDFFTLNCNFLWHKYFHRINKYYFFYISGYICCWENMNQT